MTDFSQDAQRLADAWGLPESSELLIVRVLELEAAFHRLEDRVRAIEEPDEQPDGTKV